MSQPRKPDHLHLLQGTYRPDRHGDPKDKPEPIALLGDPPKHLTKPAVQAWKEIEEIAPPGVLTCSDRLAVELLSRLIVDFRRAPSQFNSNKMIRMQILLGSFGMTPSERSKINLGHKKPKANPFDEL